MAVIVEVGGSESNSYITVSEADAYLAAMFGKDDWQDADPYDKDLIVVTASRTLDQYMEWDGRRASESQSMEWPRIDTPFTGIPKRLKDACCELSYVILTKGLSFESQTINAVKVGPISVDFSADSVDAGIPTFIEKMVQNFGSPLITGANAITTARVTRV